MLNKLTPRDAVALLTGSYGASSEDLGSHDALARLRKRLAFRHHPDRGGAPEVFQKINSAIQLLLSRPERELADLLPLGDPLDGLRKAVTEARDHGFFRIQIREMVAYPMFWKSNGYFGSVKKSQTARRTGKTAQDDEEVVQALLRYIAYTAQKIGQKGAPEDLIVKITVQAPIGRNSGHFAVAWKTQQDEIAQMFGHSERWYSITMDMPPGDARKWLARKSVDTGGIAAAQATQSKKEKWSRSKATRFMLDSGLLRISSGDRWERWAPRGTPRMGIKSTNHLVLGARTIKKSSSYEGDQQFYFGELRTRTMEDLVRWAGGHPPSSGEANRFFVQPGDIAPKKARAIAQILATNGSGTPEIWQMMDAWVAAYGMQEVLKQIGRIYVANGTTWSTGEQQWWISQLA